MINYLEGNVLNPVGDGMKIICHVVNNKGGWGAGFVVNLSKKWKTPEDSYREFCKENKGLDILGEIQVIKVEDDVLVVNMFSQNGFPTGKRPVALDYDSLEVCLENVNDFCNAYGKDISVHMPYIGCGIAGGKWEKVEEIINRTLKDQKVYVYSFK